MKRFFLLAGLFWLFFYKAAGAEAVDLVIDCGDQSCSPQSSGSLFPSSEVWYPGKFLAKTVQISNSGSVTRDTATQALNFNQSGNLDQKINLSIVQGSTDSVVWAGSLHDFYQAGEVGLAAFSPSSFDNFTYTVSMDLTADNNYQQTSTSFDLLLGFLASVITPTVTPTPTAGPTPTPSSGGGGGAVLGAGVGPASCTDSQPGTPSNLQANLGSSLGAVNLSWTPPSQPYTYFLIAYSDTSSPKWGNPNIGTSTSYTVSSLGTGTYFFWVRAGNGCQPGDFAGPVSITLNPGVSVATSVPAAGFQEGVLGEASPSGQQSSSSNQTPSLPSSVLANITSFPWPFAALAIGFLFFAFYFFFLRH